MQLGMIGLGRMGHGMTERLREHDHEICTYDPHVAERTAASLDELKRQLDAPRAFWMMVPSGEVTEDVFQDVLKIADEGEKRRIVQPLAGNVVALADLVGPRVRVAVPVPGDVLLGELRCAQASAPHAGTATGRALPRR